MTTADRIKARREELGLSQMDLAKRLGLKNKTSICKMEQAGNKLTLTTVSKVSEALNCSVAYLMGYEDNLEIEAHKDTSKSEYYLDENTSKMAQAIAGNEELSLLFDACKDASEDDLKTIHTMLLALKRKENDGNN